MKSKRKFCLQKLEEFEGLNAKEYACISGGWHKSEFTKVLAFGLFAFITIGACYHIGRKNGWWGSRHLLAGTPPDSHDHQIDGKLNTDAMPMGHGQENEVFDVINYQANHDEEDTDFHHGPSDYAWYVIDNHNMQVRSQAEMRDDPFAVKVESNIEYDEHGKPVAYGYPTQEERARAWAEYDKKRMAPTLASGVASCKDHPSYSNASGVFSKKALEKNLDGDMPASTGNASACDYICSSSNKWVQRCFSKQEKQWLKNRRAIPYWPGNNIYPEEDKSFKLDNIAPDN